MMIQCGMKQKNLIRTISNIEREYDYEENIVFGKFVEEHGEGYSKEEFIKFLRRRYEIINRFHAHDKARAAIEDDQKA